MSDQVNIRKYYPQSHLAGLVKTLKQREADIDIPTISNFTTSIRKRNSEDQLSPHLQEFLAYLDQVISTNRPLKPIQAQALLKNSFPDSSNSVDTMWQIKFLQYVFDSEMRSKLSNQGDLAPIQHRTISDDTGAKWAISKHQSFGVNPKSLEHPINSIDRLPENLVLIERPDPNYASVNDTYLADQIQKAVAEVFTKDELLKLNDLEFRDNFFNLERNEKEILKLMDKRPIQAALEALVRRNTQAGKVLLDMARDPNEIEKLVRTRNNNHSLFDIYLDHRFAYQANNTVVPLYTDADYSENSINPGQYDNAEKIRALKLEAYESLKKRFKDRPDAFVKYLLVDNYQAEVNIKPLHQKLLKAVQDLDLKGFDSQAFNLNVVVNLGNELFVYTIGDTTLIPVFHTNDKLSTDCAFRSLRDKQTLPKRDIERLELSNSQTGASKPAPQFHSALYEKEELDSLILGSRGLIKNAPKQKKKAKPETQRAAYERFLNTVIRNYNNTDTDDHRKRHSQLITDILQFTGKANPQSLFVISNLDADESPSFMSDLFDNDYSPHDGPSPFFPSSPSGERDKRMADRFVLVS